MSPAAVDLSPVAPMGLPALMTQLLADYAATGVPPAYLAMPESEAWSDNSLNTRCEG